MAAQSAPQVLPPAKEATTDAQRLSVAEKRKAEKYALYEDVCQGDLQNYFRISCRPITKRAEDDMELISDIATWGEKYLHHWEVGTYLCARCQNALYRSSEKYKGPCIWPSFRDSITPLSISTTIVYPYNNYAVTVMEVYCGKCDLFIGHKFEDGRAKGDTHPAAHWRH